MCIGIPENVCLSREERRRQNGTDGGRMKTRGLFYQTPLGSWLGVPVFLVLYVPTNAFLEVQINTLPMSLPLLRDKSLP